MSRVEGRGPRVEGNISRVEGEGKLFIESRKKIIRFQNKIYRAYLHGQKEGHSPRPFMRREWKLGQEFIVNNAEQRTEGLTASVCRDRAGPVVM